MRFKVLHNQSILDLAIQHTGSVENAFAFAIANGISVSDELISGSEMIIPDVKQNRDILNYYTSKTIRPATDITDAVTGDTPEELGGIGYMEIGRNFKVS